MRFARWPRIVLLLAAFVLGLAPAATVFANVCTATKTGAAGSIANGMACDCEEQGCLRPAQRLCVACAIAVIDSLSMDLAKPVFAAMHGTPVRLPMHGQALEPPVPPPEFLDVRHTGHQATFAQSAHINGELTC